MKQSLWMTAAPFRYFLVPLDAVWPAGSDRVEDVLGAARGVDLASLRAFEVSAEEARAFSEQETARLNADTAAQQAQRPSLDAAAARASLERLDPRIKRVLADLGLDLARLSADPQDGFVLMGELVAGAVTSTPRDLLAVWTQTLGRHGHPQAAERLPRVGPILVRSLKENGFGPLSDRLRAAREPLQEVVGLLLQVTGTPQAAAPKAPTPAPPAAATPPGPAFVPSVQSFEALLGLMGSALTPSQAQEIRDYAEQQEWALAVEFIVQFVDDNGSALSPQAHQALERALRGSGSSWSAQGLPIRA